MDMDCKRNATDPCMYYEWTIEGLIIWLSYDHYMVWVKKEQNKKEKREFMSRFDCDDVGPLKEYM